MTTLLLLFHPGPGQVKEAGDRPQPGPGLHGQGEALRQHLHHEDHCGQVPAQALRRGQGAGEDAHNGYEDFNSLWFGQHRFLNPFVGHDLCIQVSRLLIVFCIVS